MKPKFRYLCNATFVLVFGVSWILVELFILPIEFFSPRPYEALVATDVIPKYQLGKFYPNQKLSMWEAGDRIGYVPVKSRKKFNYWETDSYGFRNRQDIVTQANDDFDIVITGDSMIAGSYLDQKDTFSEVLSKLCNCSTYNYGSVNQRWRFLHDDRFIQNPPDYVIFQTQVSYMVVEDGPWKKMGKSKFIIQEKPMNDNILVIWDRLYKQAGFRWLRSRLNTIRNEKKTSSIITDKSVLKKKVFQEVMFVKDEVEKRGSKFILLVLPSTDPSLDKTFEYLREHDVSIISFAENETFPDGFGFQNFFHKEDTHWQEWAVVFTAKKLMRKIGVNHD